MRHFLTATDLMKYLYDPMIIYFMYVLKAPQLMTPKAIEGLKKYEEFQIKSRRTKIITELPHLKKLYNVYLSSPKYGFATKVDCIALDFKKKEAYPIQVKYSVKPRVLYRGQKFQVVMEAMLIEEHFNYSVPFGFIKFLKSNGIAKVIITEPLKKELLEIFLAIECIIKEERIPKPTPHKKKRIDSVYKNIDIQ